MKMLKVIGWAALGSSLLFGAYLCYLILQDWVAEDLKGKEP